MDDLWEIVSAMRPKTPSNLVGANIARIVLWDCLRRFSRRRLDVVRAPPMVRLAGQLGTLVSPPSADWTASVRILERSLGEINGDEGSVSLLVSRDASNPQPRS